MEVKSLADQLSMTGIIPRKVMAVFLTHSDFDHTAGLSLFPAAKVYLFREEEQMINGKRKRSFFSRNSPVKDYTLLDDQQTFVFGNLTLKAVAAPGHTPGSVCYQVNEKYLFTGDALLLKKGNVEPFIPLFTMDKKTMRESLRKLAQLKEVEYIFTGHHGYTDKAGSAFEKWRN